MKRTAIIVKYQVYMTARRSFTGSKVKVTETFSCEDIHVHEDIHVPINGSPHGVDFYLVSRSKMPSPKADVIRPGMGTRRKSSRPRRDRDAHLPRPRRGRDVGFTSRDETETRRL